MKRFKLPMGLRVSVPFLVTPEPSCFSEGANKRTESRTRCHFRSQTAFNAARRMDHLRGAIFCPTPKPVVKSVWDIKPCDFSVKNYPPRYKRQLRSVSQSMGDFDSMVRTEKKKMRSRDHLRTSVQDRRHSQENKDFVLRFRITTPNTSRKMVARKNGKLSPYSDPKPHEHREFPPVKWFGHPEIDTKIRPDPYNLNFKKKKLDILNCPQQPLDRYLSMKSQWGPRQTPEPHFIKALYLPKEPYRKRYPAFTRHRRLDRSVYSALMDRVEETLASQWSS